MTEPGREAPREALAATVAGVLRLHARRSVHPADQAALRQAAVQIALALQTEFRVLARHSAAVEPIGYAELSEPVHE